MKRERYAEWWASPPKLVGPLVVVLLVLGFAVFGFFVAAGRFQEALVTCAVGAVLLLAAVVDLLAELIRYQRLILDGLESPKSRQDQ
jgi:hypothetical protein